jgi:hypothetical protein
VKGVQRDNDGKVIVPEGMTFVPAHASVNKKGLQPKEVTVAEHYRKLKGKRRPPGLLTRWFRTLRWWWRWLK